MRKAVISMVLCLNLFSLYSQTILPVYTDVKRVRVDRIINKNFPVRETYPLSEIKIVNNDDALGILIEGSQLESVDAVDLPTLVFSYNNQKYWFAYQYYIYNSPLLLDIDVKKIVGADSSWLVKLTTIAAGEVGPKFPVYTFFVLQYINNLMIISDSVFSVSEEPSNNKMVFETFQFEKNFWYNIGDKKYYLQDNILVSDVRFNVSKNTILNILIDNLNIRSSPSVKSSIICTLNAGSNVKVIKYAGQAERIDNFVSPWIEVEFRNNGLNQIGYIFGAYVK